MDRLSHEVAEAEFSRFGELMDLDFDLDGASEEDQETFEQQKRRVTAALQNGSLVFNDEGEPIFSPQRSDWSGDPIRFREPTGATYLAMDRRKKSQEMSKFFAVMADMTGLSSAALSRLKGSDIKLCQTLVALFLA